MKFPMPGLIIPGLAGQMLRLDAPLGGGAFGFVFTAVADGGGMVYAVKFPRMAFPGMQELTAFQNEVLAAREIVHPNVVRVFHVETNPPEVPPYLVMEFIDGGTLESSLDRYRKAGQAVPLATLQTWTTGLVEGIAAINLRMLHRDLKLDNVLMDDNTPKIGDFGLSKIVGAATRSQTFKGGQHVLYMAPEGWKLETNEVQLDMYSMGIMLYQLATLKYPYDLPMDTSDLAALQDMHLFSQAVLPQRLRPDLPIGFCHIVMRLMEKSPRDRFAGWEEVKAALTRAWETVTTGIPGPSGRVTDLLNQTALEHARVSEVRLEQDRQQRAQQEQHKLDDYQAEKLLDGIRANIIEFNEHSSLGRITERSTAAGPFRAYQFGLPFGRGITIVFSQIDPPLNLRVGLVRFAAYVQDNEGYGFNYLLARKDESDLYGTWKVCHVRYSAIVRHDPRPEPFGFSGPDIHEIDVADHATHIYVVDFSDDIAGAFVELAVNALKRTGRIGDK